MHGNNTTYDNNKCEELLSQTTKNKYRIYLSGPVTLYNDNDKARQLFNKYEQELERAISFKEVEQLKMFSNDDITIVNPVKINEVMPSFNTNDWGDFMVFDLFLLNQCDAIVMLPNWELSNGARFEKQFAEYCKDRIELIEFNFNNI